MKKKLFCLLLILVLPVCLLFTGCSKTAQSSSTGEEFIVGDIILVKIAKTSNFSIFVDKNTRVMYLYNTTNYQGGLTVMLDADGKPLLYEGEL